MAVSGDVLSAVCESGPGALDAVLEFGLRWFVKCDGLTGIWASRHAARLRGPRQPSVVNALLVRLMRVVMIFIFVGCSSRPWDAVVATLSAHRPQKRRCV